MKEPIYKFIDIHNIVANEKQPRTHFEKEKIQEESIEGLEKGIDNLYRHIENIKNKFGLNVIVAISLPPGIFALPANFEHIAIATPSAPAGWFSLFPTSIVTPSIFPASAETNCNFVLSNSKSNHHIWLLLQLLLVYHQ